MKEDLIMYSRSIVTKSDIGQIGLDRGRAFSTGIPRNDI